ncbi:MAG: hypothetical protein ABI783_01605 [Actinomycetota bacterium]
MAGRSPAGDRIAFLRARDSRDINPDLYVVDTSGRGLRKLVSDVDGDQLAWSPDGTQIALSRSGGGLSGIEILDVADRRLRHLSLGPFESPPSSPAWSPDGTTIAYATGFAIKTVPITGGRAVELTDTEPFEVENWSPTWCRGS